MRFRAVPPSLLILDHTRGIHRIWGRSLGTRTNLLRALVVCTIGMLAGGNGLQAQTCPAYGADTDCGTIITVKDSGTTIMSTGQGPYDGFDDTLVGVVNMSSTPLHALALKSINNIFAFDGDGIVGYGAPGNAMDGSGYGGPNAYFTGIDTTQSMGVVNFVTPIAPGGKTYFSLENAISSAYSCQDVVNGGFMAPPSGATGSPNIDVTFTPKMGLTLQQAAQFCGFVNFNWVQHITHQDNPALFYARNLGGAFDPGITGPVNLSSTRTPYSDPPQGGGYTYSAAPDYSYPFYYDTSTELPGQETGGYTLKFHDAPADPCLPGGPSAGTAACMNMTEPAGAYGGYTLHLAGVNADGTATDLMIGIDYTSNYNGTTGGLSIKKTFAVADGNGTGGITIGTVTEDTAYQYNGLTVTGVNGSSGSSGSGTQSIYVADNWRVQRFTTAGAYISQYTIDGSNLFPFGPGGLAVDSLGNAFLTDVFNKSVSEFDTNGAFVRTFGSYGSGNGQFTDGLSGVAIDSSGNVLVVDKGNNRVESFSNTGVYLGQFGVRGHAPGQFVDPVAIAVDGGGHIFVADAFRVQEFTSGGVYMGQFALNAGGGFLFGPGGLSVDAKGNVFVSDTANKTIVEFDPNGNVLNSFGSYGSGAGMFLNGIGAVSLDMAGDILVGDSGNNRVQDFNAAGVFQNQFGARGNGNGQFNGSVAVAVGP